MTTKKAESEWSDRIVCPYCGKADDEYTDYPVTLRRDGDSAPYVCSSCDKDFTVTLTVEYSYKGTTQ